MFSFSSWYQIYPWSIRDVEKFLLFIFVEFYAFRIVTSVRIMGLQMSFHVATKSKSFTTFDTFMRFLAYKIERKIFQFQKYFDVYLVCIQWKILCEKGVTEYCQWLKYEKIFEVPVCKNRWFFRLVTLLKPLSQMWHRCGQLPLWIYIWDLRSPGVGKDFWQSSHLWGFSCN